MKDVDKVLTELTAYKRQLEGKLILWERVKRATKKNGGEFANLAKNFIGASVIQPSYSLRDDRRLQVSGNVPVWTTDEIEIVPLVKYFKDFDVPEDRIIDEPMLENYFVLTVDEIFDRIEKRKEQIRQEIKDYEKQISMARNVYNTFTEKIDSALRELSEECGANSSLYYLCREYMKTAY